MSNISGIDTNVARQRLTDLSGKLEADAEAYKSCIVFLGSKAGRRKQDRWKRMKFDASLAAEFRDEVVDALLQVVEAKDTVEPYAFDDMVSGHMGYLDKSESSILAQWFDEIPPPEWPHVFDGDPHFLSRVKYYVTAIPVDGPDDVLRVFRHRGGASLVHKGLFALFDTTENQFRMAKQKVFHFDHGVDFFEWGGVIYICNHNRFESLTDMRTITAEKAGECLAGIEKKKDIHVGCLAELQHVIESKPLYAKKLASALTQGVIVKLTGKAMAERIKTKKLPIKWSQNGGKYTFTLNPENAAHVREFVYLVTDYYLNSPVTRIEYRVPSKYPAA